MFICLSQKTENHNSYFLLRSVNKLRPGDIEIIASLGDSIIGATGGDADNLFHAREQFRGISFASGARVRRTFIFFT